MEEEEIKLLDKEEEIQPEEGQKNLNESESLIKKVEDDSIMEIELLGRDEKKQISKQISIEEVEEDNQEEEKRDIVDIKVSSDRSGDQLALKEMDNKVIKLPMNDNR